MKISNIFDKTLKVLTSPEVVLAFTTASVLVKLAHEFLKYKQTTRRIGFH